ncbi:FAD-binding oxidoreductase [Amycolatopsis echigonensis]|uniref:2Fe-2S iron-sulfur cluster binding domain-containing protein n=1 Tax=Amycolatopsis echigonensis TaxID=2576905 RepID=A0A2N3X0C6_9PSEU|nr:MULTISPECIES: FAD-binding oxidoreductase [Amycolatopsis]MBB2501213.1 2Fe-2S iron-sulfur cluster binding domain-containing protein [Amycolatopsis echigonensis]PKV99567.1 propane monooxygenase reductase subunit [Amycolatopsis niigatensis]
MGDKHRISFEPVGVEIEVTEDEKILDAAFRQGVHLMHGCREGQCSACKSYVLEGDLQMERYSTFACNDAEVEEGYLLLCRAHAYSDCTIELLNFDEDELLNSAPLQEIATEVAEIVPHTRDIVGLRLRTASPLQYKAGQYAELTIPGTEDCRSFSMATTPSTEDHVEFLIKKYPGGRFSALLEDGLAVGDSLLLRGPYGNFTLKKGHVLPLVLMAGGAGMAPVLSLLRHLAETADPRRIRFYYGARTAADLFCLDEIRTLGERLADFGFVVALSESADGAGELGVAVEPGMVTDVVEAREPELHRAEVYLCGPPPMVDAALDLATRQGVPEDQVFYDKFTTSVSDDQ